MCGSLMQNLKSGKNTLWCQKSRKCSHLDMEGFFRGWYEQWRGVMGCKIFCFWIWVLVAWVGSHCETSMSLVNVQFMFYFKRKFTENVRTLHSTDHREALNEKKLEDSYDRRWIERSKFFRKKRMEGMKLGLEWEWDTLKTKTKYWAPKERESSHINNVGSNRAHFQASGFRGKCLEAFLFPWAGIGTITSRKLV